EGAADVVPTYSLLSRTPTSDPNLFRARPPRHAEFLVDRQGYIRARWLADEAGPGWRDPKAPLAEIRTLDREPPARPPAEHVRGRSADEALARGGADDPRSLPRPVPRLPRVGPPVPARSGRASAPAGAGDRAHVGGARRDPRDLPRPEPRHRDPRRDPRLHG